ncbi:hypothetical protein [Aquirhabdus sp.]|uniref:hypothetical protein n=1 Tax=Aquirhabdus sp. TaxID=2824160 RepID=UPI00396CF562
MLKKIFIVGLAYAMSPFANAAIVSMEAVPTAWRLQQYTGGDLVAWFTPATCASGQIKMPAGEAQRNRFWALILTAKATSNKVVIEYDNAASCTITSFSMKES